MKRDILGWLSLAATFVVTASAEYHLARVCGFGVYVAGAVPAALDIYALRALRASRDMAAVVIAMATVNALSHLVSAELIPVSWPLVVAVSCIAPLVMWRVHALREGLHGVESAPAPGVSAPEDHPGYVLQRASEAVDTPLPTPTTRYVGAFDKAPKERPPSTPVVPLYPRRELEGSGGSGGGVPADEKSDGYVPEPVPRDEPEAATEPEDELTGPAREEFAGLLDDGRTPSIRQLRSTYSIGQPRAERIQRQLAA